MTEPAEKLETVQGDPFDALGDKHRRSIVRILSQGEQPVQYLADQLPITRPAVSRHLRVLKHAGLVTDRAEGTRRLYRLDKAGIDSVRTFVDAMWGSAIGRFTMFAENTAPTPDTERP